MVMVPFKPAVSNVFFGRPVNAILIRSYPSGISGSAECTYALSMSSSTSTERIGLADFARPRTV